MQSRRVSAVQWRPCAPYVQDVAFAAAGEERSRTVRRVVQEAQEAAKDVHMLHR